MSSIASDYYLKNVNGEAFRSAICDILYTPKDTYKCGSCTTRLDRDYIAWMCNSCYNYILMGQNQDHDDPERCRPCFDWRMSDDFCVDGYWADMTTVAKKYPHETHLQLIQDDITTLGRLSKCCAKCAFINQAYVNTDVSITKLFADQDKLPIPEIVVSPIKKTAQEHIRCLTYYYRINEAGLELLEVARDETATKKNNVINKFPRNLLYYLKRGNTVDMANIILAKENLKVVLTLAADGKVQRIMVTHIVQKAQSRQLCNSSGFLFNLTEL